MMPSITGEDIEVGSSGRGDGQYAPGIITYDYEDEPAPETEAGVDDESEYIIGIRLFLMILGL